jgi:hypothetical protein
MRIISSIAIIGITASLIPQVESSSSSRSLVRPPVRTAVQPHRVSGEVVIGRTSELVNALIEYNGRTHGDMELSSSLYDSLQEAIVFPELKPQLEELLRSIVRAELDHIVSSATAEPGPALGDALVRSYRLEFMLREKVEKAIAEILINEAKKLIGHLIEEGNEEANIHHFNHLMNELALYPTSEGKLKDLLADVTRTLSHSSIRGTERRIGVVKKSIERTIVAQGLIPKAESAMIELLNQISRSISSTDTALAVKFRHIIEQVKQYPELMPKVIELHRYAESYREARIAKMDARDVTGFRDRVEYHIMNPIAQAIQPTEH